MNTSAVILAAGRGARFGGEGNKIWALLAGQPLLWHALAAFVRCGAVDEIVVVVRPGEEGDVAVLARENSFPAVVVVGGERRQDSALAGIEATCGEYVLVHDGARPLVSQDLIRRVLDATRRHGAAVPVVPVADTVRYAGEGFLKRDAVDREGLVQIQTPQGFRRELLLHAYAAATARGVALPDDAAAVLAVDHPVAVIAGDAGNLKVTRREDLAVAERFLVTSS